MRSMGLVYMKHEQNKFQCKSFLHKLPCSIRCDNSCKSGFMNYIQGHLFCVFNEARRGSRSRNYTAFIFNSPCQKRREATFGCAIVHYLTGGIFMLDLTLSHVHLFGYNQRQSGRSRLISLKAASHLKKGIKCLSVQSIF